MVHISELADYRVPSVEDVVKVGDEIMVMVTEIDRMGRINLSRRAVLQGLSKTDMVKNTAAPGFPGKLYNPPPRSRGSDLERRPRGGPPRRYPDRGRKPPQR